MELSFLGACREVGRAAILVEEEKTRILLDYGLKINEETMLPLPVQGFLDGLIISHSHLDHSGAAPLLYKTTEAPCYITPPSLPMINLLVKDSIKVNKLKGLEAIFTKAHLKRMIRGIIPVEYNKKIRIGGFEFTFRNAGHILGSASVELRGKHSLVYTGDIKFEDTRLHTKAFDGFKDVDVLVTESTYGKREHPDRKMLEKKFVEECRKICDKNGNVLVPAFAVDRTQEIITILKACNFDYPVYMDGMGKKAAEIMFDFPDYLRNFNEMYSALKKAEWVYDEKTREKALKEPSVIVSTAGMMQGGPAVSYLMKMHDLPNQAIFFSGFQPEGTPGKILLEEKRFKHKDFDINCSGMNIQYFDFSAHCGCKSLQNFVKKLNPKMVFVIHGDEENSGSLASWIKKEIGCYTFIPRLGEKIDASKYL